MRSPSGSRAGPVAAVVSGSALYAIGPVLAGAADVTGPVFAFWRLWLGIVVMFVGLGAWWLVGRGTRPVGRRSGLAVSAAAGLALGVQQIALSSAVQRTAAADVMVVNAVGPLLLVLATTLVVSPRSLRPRYLAWCGVVLAGVVLTLASAAGGARSAEGTAQAVLSMVGFTAFLALARPARRTVPLAVFLTVSMVVAAGVASTVVLVDAAPVGAVPARALVLAAAVAVGPGGVAHVLTTWPLDRLPLRLPMTVRLGQPAVTAVTAWLALGEALTVAELLGGLLTVVGLVRALGADRPSGPGATS